MPQFVIAGGSDEVHHSALFHNQTFPAHVVTFPPKLCVPVSRWNILTCNALGSVWASCFREKLTDEGKFCKCLYSFEEWGSRICTFLCLSLSDPSHFSLMMCRNKNFPFSRANTRFCGSYRIKLSFARCPMFTVHISGKHWFKHEKSLPFFRASYFYL